MVEVPGREENLRHLMSLDQTGDQAVGSIADADLLDVDIAPIVVVLDLLDEAIVVIIVADDHTPMMAVVPTVTVMAMLPLPAGFSGGCERDGGDENSRGCDDELFHGGCPLGFVCVEGPVQSSSFLCG